MSLSLQLHTVVSEFEHNKLELEQHHAKQNQLLLQEMSVRISSLKEDHKTQRKNEVRSLACVQVSQYKIDYQRDTITCRII